MSRLLLFAALLTVAGTSAPGRQLHKCVAPGGAVSYQDQPCAPEARQAWVQPVKAEAVPAGSARPPPRPPARERPARPATVRPSAPDPRRAHCERVRREAEERRDRLWNKLSFAERSALDAEVARACRRPG